MKQLSTLGARRHFFRSPRRAMRPLRPGLAHDGLEDSPEMVGGPNGAFGYFSGEYKALGDGRWPSLLAMFVFAAALVVCRCLRVFCSRQRAHKGRASGLQCAREWIAEWLAKPTHAYTHTHTHTTRAQKWD